MGSTRDDAAGEAYDKVARLLGLPYPGGLPIDRLAQKGDPQAIRFPARAERPGRRSTGRFSGLKTAVLNHVRKHGVPEGQALADLCASFQEAVADALSRSWWPRRAGCTQATGALRRRGGELAAARAAPGAGSGSGIRAATCRRRGCARTTAR